MRISTTIFLLFLADLACTESTLLFISSIWRHADRAPARSFSSEQTEKDPLFSNGLGQLTNLGIEHAFALGEYVKEKYVENGFISGPEQVKIRSTIHDRTQRTANEMLRAMFGGSEGVQMDVQRGADWLLRPSPTKCPIVAEIQNTKCEGQVHLPNYTKFEDYEYDLWMCSGEYKKAKFFTKEKESFMQMESVLNEYLNGYNFPSSSGITGDHIAEADKMYRLIQRLTLGIGEYHEPFILKVYSGELLTNILSQMKLRIDCSLADNCDRYRFQGYSSQDLQIFPMLEILNSTIPAVGSSAPLYTSAIFFELHRINGEFQVKILYRRDHQNTVIDITPNVPNCGGHSPCPFDSFSSCCPFFLSESNKETCNNLKDIQRRLKWIRGHTVDGIVEPQEAANPASHLHFIFILSSLFLLNL